jgi:hypothetical protein
MWRVLPEATARPGRSSCGWGCHRCILWPSYAASTPPGAPAPPQAAPQSQHALQWFASTGSIRPCNRDAPRPSKAAGGTHKRRVQLLPPHQATQQCNINNTTLLMSAVPHSAHSCCRPTPQHTCCCTHVPLLPYHAPILQHEAPCWLVLEGIRHSRALAGNRQP